MEERHISRHPSQNGSNLSCRQLAAVAVEPVLRVEGVNKAFGATNALRDVSLEVRAGQVVALLGQNGAGKSTLIKIIAGVYDADRGQVTVGGGDYDSDQRRARVAFIHQDLALVPEMSIAENVALALGYPRSKGLVSWKKTKKNGDEALAQLSIDLRSSTLVCDISMAERAMVAIARAVARNPRLLILDEPTAALGPSEVERVLGLVSTLQKRGVGMVYVSHRLDEISRIADRVVVLRDGVVVLSEAMGSLEPEDVVGAVAGRLVRGSTRTKPVGHSGNVLLRLDNVVTVGAGPVSLSVRSGEICGLTGLAGCGSHEIGRLVAGEAKCAAGEVIWKGSIVSRTSLPIMTSLGVSFTSGSREEATAQTLSVRENLYPRPAVLGAQVIRPRRERRLATESLKRFAVRPPETELPVGHLSGGNQQKVVLARALMSGGTLLVLEEPTSGVDVGARADIYAMLREGVRNGAGVLLVSSDLKEVAEVCDRAIVLRRGRLSAELAGQELSEAALLAAAAGFRRMSRGRAGA